MLQKADQARPAAGLAGAGLTQNHSSVTEAMGPHVQQTIHVKIYSGFVIAYLFIFFHPGHLIFEIPSGSTPMFAYCCKMKHM